MIDPIRLTQEQFFRVTEIIRGELCEWLMGTRPNYTEAAKRIAEKLGYPVSDQAVRRANKLCGVWEPVAAERAKKAAAKVELPSKVAELQKRLDHAQAEIAHLNLLVHHLYYELNCRPPAGVTLPTDINKASRMPVLQNGK